MPTYYFKSMPGTAEFRAELDACKAGKPQDKRTRGAIRSKPGSVSALIALYYGTPEFTGLAESTKVTYRGILERFRIKHGEKSVTNLTRSHIKFILGEMSATPSAANNLLDRLKPLMALAVDEGWRKDDPTYRVRGFKIDSDGFHTWTEDEIAKFEKRHPIGSKARLAFALMLYTGQRRSDAVTMGWQHVSGNRIAVKQLKTKARLSIPMHHELQAAIAAAPKTDLTFLLTEYGKPHSAKGFGNWVSKRAEEAGIKGCSSHGLRKAAARRLAEAGCSNQQIKAITGHKTDKEISRYTAAADQIILSDQAIDAIGGTDAERKVGSPKK